MRGRDCSPVQRRLHDLVTAEHATDRQPLADGDGVRVVFDPSVPLDEMARLAVAEQGCCAFFAFAITVDARGLALELRAPADAADLVTAVFGPTA